jgi:putative DNA methylase
MLVEKIEKTYVSPDISDVPKGCEIRLVDSGMLHYEASVAGYNERYLRGETSHTIHVWWARRPHSAMRALVFASLAKDTSNNAAAIMAELAMGNNDEVESAARKIISSGYESTPKVLDMFGGGGTIPFESKNLGADTYSIDANQLSVFIQKCNMIYANQVDLTVARETVEKSGNAILSRLEVDTDWLYPLRKKNAGKTFGYMWSYKTVCTNCGRSFHLIKRPWLSTKKGKHLSFIWADSAGMETIEICQVPEDYSFSPAWEKGTGRCFCPYCHTLQEKIDIAKCEDTLLAVIDSEKSGKTFHLAPNDAVPSLSDIDEEERRVLRVLNTILPQSELPVWSGIVNPALYGVKTHADFLNRRQRLLLLYLIKELLAEFETLKFGDAILAKFTIGVLSSLIDQIVDWNCRMSMWIPGNEQVGRAFCGPGVAMLWDYTETDMLLHGPANIWDKLNRIVKGVSSFEHTEGTITIEHAHAQELPFANDMFDAIVTDPPYYDNIYYSILADFFYAWKRILLQKIEPDLFSNVHTDIEFELVASSRRQGKGKDAHESYCIELKQAFSEAARVIKPDGVFSFIYSHSSVNGWDSIIQSYRSSPFWITSVQPLSIERKGRPRSVMSEAVNTCMTFIARKNTSERMPISMNELQSRISIITDSFGKQLTEQSGWNGADAGLAVLAYAVGLIANAKYVTDASSDADALIIISKQIKKSFPEFTLKIRSSL